MIILRNTDCLRQVATQRGKQILLYACICEYLWILRQGDEVNNLKTLRRKGVQVSKNSLLKSGKILEPKQEYLKILKEILISLKTTGNPVSPF